MNVYWFERPGVPFEDQYLYFDAPTLPTDTRREGILAGFDAGNGIVLVNDKWGVHFTRVQIVSLRTEYPK